MEGFLFLSGEDARLARQEKERALYLERHIDYRNPANVLAIYHKAMENRTFRTPVGLEFMKKLQTYLDGTPLREQARDIPVLQTYTLPRLDDQPNARERVRSNPLGQMRKKYRRSLRINIVLAGMVLLMFWITVTAEKPNILNYRRALLNEYSTWEQELTERENAVREKERELQLD